MLSAGSWPGAIEHSTATGTASIPTSVDDWISASTRRARAAGGPACEARDVTRLGHGVAESRTQMAEIRRTTDIHALKGFFTNAREVPQHATAILGW
jgi:hypothetical protein